MALDKDIIILDEQIKKHRPLLIGEQIDISALALSDSPWNFLNKTALGELEAVPTDYYLDYNGNTIFWGNNLVTQENLTEILSNLTGIEGFMIITPEMLNEQKNYFNDSILELQHKFVDGVLYIYSILYDYPSFFLCNGEGDNPNYISGSNHL